MADFEVVLLGTGNPVPDANRAGAATLVTAGSTRLLVDAGRGVLMRLTAAGVLPLMLDAVLLTHLHSDHICDLNDVVTTHWVMSQEPTTLRIFGPPGTAAVVDGMRAMLAARRQLPHRPPRRPHVGTAARCGRGGRRATCSKRTACASSRRRPTTGPSSPRSATASSTTGGRSVLAGDTVPCEGLDDAVPRRRRLRADGAARRPRAHGADASVPGHHRLPLDAGAGRADRAAHGRAHARPHAPDPHAGAGLGRRVGRDRPASTSPARSCSPTTSRPSRSDRRRASRRRAAACCGRCA